MFQRWLSMALIGITASSCFAQPAPAPTVSQPDPIPLGGEQPVDSRPDVVLIATVDKPVAIAFRRDDEGIYVAQKGGRIVVIRDGRVAEEPVIDLSGEVSGLYEQGLLGLAFSPDGSHMYVNFTDLKGNTHVEEFALDGDGVTKSSRRMVLFVEQPSPIHNGGHLLFGPDGHLYVGLGDGGERRDPHDNGQNPRTLLGSILRIDPAPAGSQPYGIPSDNPFVGVPRAREEIWAYGLRHPWRFSFDRETGDLWIADVGHNKWEEINYQPADSSGGENYGWKRLEGTDRFTNREVPEDALYPLFEYTSHPCHAVIGGFVYRGEQHPQLRGTYLFGDLCDDRLRALRQQAGEIVEYRILHIRVPSLTAFGEDARGELYMCSLDGGVFRLE